MNEPLLVFAPTWIYFARAEMARLGMETPPSHETPPRRQLTKYRLWSPKTIITPLTGAASEHR